MSQQQMSKSSPSIVSILTQDSDFYCAPAEDYLADLRNPAKVARPTGSRPYPGPSGRLSLRASASQDLSRNRYSLPPSESSTAHDVTRSSSSLSKGLSQDPSTHVSSDKPRPPSYMDREERQKEKLEARVVRLALEGMDLKEEERIAAAAHQEAEKLIWKHKNPDAAYRVPSQSVVEPTPNPSDFSLKDPSAVPISMQERSDTITVLKKRSSYSKLAGLWNPSSLSHRRRSSGQSRSASGKHKGLFDNPQDKIYEDPAERASALPERELAKDVEQTKPAAAAPLPIHVRKNPFARAHARRSVPAVEPVLPVEPLATQPGSSELPQADITRSKTALSETPLEGPSPKKEDLRYMDGMEVRSDELRAATSFRLKDRSPRLPSPTAVTDNSKRPIVSFRPDWTPPKQDQKHNSCDEAVKSRPSPLPQSLNDEQGREPVKSASAPVVPTISQPGIPTIQYNNGRLVGPPRISEPPRGTQSRSKSPVPPIPTINVSPTPEINVTPIPTINVPGDLPAKADNAKRHGSTRQAKPMNFQARGHRPHAIHSATVPATSKPAWKSSSVRRTTALCAQCALPISGKIVTAAESRFHPNCFTCFTCNEQLECVAFYPEPAEKRVERLDRIERRAAGEEILDDDGHPETPETIEADGDDSLRFYCHLDFHELFSPRCKSCKTPIEGEVVVACGAEWHVGHFFCAECGDVSLPSDSHWK